tara:strand:- start:3832 stop:4287 length:456 start_codon:yes stop_codon:yes gene_type:complete
MARPQPQELLVKFFPELIDKKVSSKNKEASKELNVRICEAIISDLINKYDSLYSYMGEGALIVRLGSRHGKDNIDNNNYINRFTLEKDLRDARENKDETVAEFFTDVINKVKATDVNEEICIVLVDNSGGSACVIPRDNPAKRISAMMDGL